MEDVFFFLFFSKRRWREEKSAPAFCACGIALARVCPKSPKIFLRWIMMMTPWGILPPPPPSTHSACWPEQGFFFPVMSLKSNLERDDDNENWN